LVILSLPTIAYFVIRQSKVQAYLVNKISTKFSEFLGTSVTLSAADIDLWNIKLHNFCVHSPQNDTILYIPELKVRFNNLTLSSKYLEISKIKMVNPDINFFIDSTRTINFLFILKKLGMTDTIQNPHPMIVSIKEIDLVNADFTLKSYNKIKRDSGINFSDLQVKPLNLTVTNFRSDHGVNMNIEECSGIEKSGFVIKQFTSQLKLNKKNMAFNHMTLITPLSEIRALQVLFNFNRFNELRPVIFGKNVNLNIELEPSDISSEDIAWFAPSLKQYDIKVRVSGHVYGRFSDLKIRNLDLLYGSQTHLKGNIDITGLPNFGSSFLHVDIKNLYTTPADIESIKLPKHKKGRLILPEQFRFFTFLTYRGKFTGFIHDFVAYGKVTSNLGNIESDISLQPDTSNYLNFKGQIKTDQFNIGKFINKSNLLGTISLNAIVNGRIDRAKKIQATFDGSIHSFVCNNYNYQNVILKGTLSGKTYDGSISISDPNINGSFLGKVNLSSRVPVFNFQANVKDARLYKLNLDKKDTGAVASFYITADFEGNNVDNLNGEIRLWNALFKKSNKEIQVSDLRIFTKSISDINHIILQSDLADAEIWGTYHFKELVNSFKRLASDYVPSLFDGTPLMVSNNNFKFEVNFKNTQQLTDFFVPGLYFSKDSKLSGLYNPSKNDFNFYLNIPLLQHKSKKWYNVFFNGKTIKGEFVLTSGCTALKLNNKWTLENLSINSGIKSDSMNLDVHWNNFDTIVNKGDLAILASLKSIPFRSKPIIDFIVEPSKVVLNDSLWQLHSGIIEIDSSEINVNHFVVTHKDQSIEMLGAISRQPNKALSFELKNLDLSNLDSLISIKKIDIGGIVNGKTDLLNIYQNPVLKASLTVDSFSVNGVSLGKTLISAIYDNSNKNITLDAFSERGSIRTLNIKGAYATISKNLDFNIDLNKLRLDIFKPFLATIFTDVHGIATGSLSLTGTTKAPLLNGLVNAQKTNFIVNYLKTRYSFTNNIEIKNNTFLLNNVEVFDSKANKAIVKGKIEYRNLKELNVDMTIDAKKFECLNTTEKDNSMFYGKGYASGSVSIQGTQRSLTMDINATTEAPTNQKTVIFIPLGIKSELAESNYIRFVSKKQANLPTDQYEIDKINEKNKKKVDIVTSPLRLNLTLNVTPEAEVQIVFDPKIGDIIKGNGSGVLKMNLERGIFNMYGTYTIEKGDYLFTLGNIINKKFDIVEGGTIAWNGNPLDAIINIQAFYGLNTSLYTLGLGTSGEFQKNVWVETRLFLTDKLMNPAIRYDIYLPNADQETRNLFNNAVNTDEEISNQVLALLFTRNFIPTKSTANSPSGYSAAGANGLEFLSNQLSRMLSQISKDFDIGVNYRPGDYISSDQVAVAFSTQLLNNKVLINGNVDVGGKQTTSTSNSSNIVGEGNIEVKLTDNGKLRFKAFNRSNESYYTDLSPYTQGVGFSYKENFNTVGGLLKRYYKKLFTRKEEKNEPVTETENNKSPNQDTGNE
jgi:hypothetical protein